MLAMTSFQTQKIGVSKLNEPKGKNHEAHYKKIAVEEHFSTVEHLDHLRAILKKTYPDPKVVDEERFIASDAPFLPISNRPRSVKCSILFWTLVKADYRR